MLLLQYGSKCECCFFSTDPHQALHQPQLNVTGIPLTFNSTPSFSERPLTELSFGSHFHSLHTKFFTRFKALRSVPFAPWGPSKAKVFNLFCLVYPLLNKKQWNLPPSSWRPLLKKCNTSFLFTTANIKNVFLVAEDMIVVDMVLWK